MSEIVERGGRVYAVETHEPEHEGATGYDIEIDITDAVRAYAENLEFGSNIPRWRPFSENTGPAMLVIAKYTRPGGEQVVMPMRWVGKQLELLNGGRVRAIVDAIIPIDYLLRLPGAPKP